MGQLKKIRRRRLLNEAKANPMTLEETGIPQAVQAALTAGIHVEEAEKEILRSLPGLPERAQNNLKGYIRTQYAVRVEETRPNLSAPEIKRRPLLSWAVVTLVLMGAAYIAWRFRHP